MRFSAVAPPPETATPVSPPIASEIAAATDVAWIVASSFAVTPTAPPEVFSEVTPEIYDVTGSLMMLAAIDRPMATATPVSPAKAALTAAAPAVEVIVAASEAATATAPSAAIECAPPPSI